MKRCIIIPAGRKRFMQILIPYILEAKTVDEIHIWLNARDKLDAEYIENELPKMSSKISIVRVNNNPYPSTHDGSYNKFYFSDSVDENSVYLKIDDDVLWFSPGAIDKTFDYRIAHPEYFLVSPTIINNITTYMMYGDKLNLTDEEKKQLDNEWHNYRSIKDAVWFRNPDFAVKAHNFLFDNLNDLSKLCVEDKRLHSTRYSINAICYFGIDLKNVIPFF